MNKRFWICRFTIACLAVAVLSAAAGAQSGKKSPGRAFLSSLLVPGLGQHYVESHGSIKYFAAAEVVMFGAAFGLEQYSDWLEEDYRAYAAEHAGVNPEGKDKDYYVEISKYNSIFIYNEKARIDRDPDSVIPETPGNIWVWDSAENRINFHYKRVDADNTSNRAIYFWTGIFVNHLVSGIHAAILAKRHNDRLDAGLSNWSAKVVPKVSASNPGVRFKLSYSF